MYLYFQLRHCQVNVAREFLIAFQFSFCICNFLSWLRVAESKDDSGMANRLNVWLPHFWNLALHALPDNVIPYSTNFFKETTFLHWFLMTCVLEFRNIYFQSSFKWPKKWYINKLKNMSSMPRLTIFSSKAFLITFADKRLMCPSRIGNFM